MNMQRRLGCRSFLPAAPAAGSDCTGGGRSEPLAEARGWFGTSLLVVGRPAGGEEIGESAENQKSAHRYLLQKH